MFPPALPVSVRFKNRVKYFMWVFCVFLDFGFVCSASFCHRANGFNYMVLFSVFLKIGTFSPPWLPTPLPRGHLAVPGDLLCFGCAGSPLLGQLFSSCDRGYSPVAVLRLLRQRLLLLWNVGIQGSEVAACGLSSCSSLALEHRLNSCGTRA